MSNVAYGAIIPDFKVCEMPKFLHGECWRIIRANNHMTERICAKPAAMYEMTRPDRANDVCRLEPSLGVRVSLCDKCVEKVTQAGYNLRKVLAP